MSANNNCSPNKTNRASATAVPTVPIIIIVITGDDRVDSFLHFFFLPSNPLQYAILTEKTRFMLPRFRI